MGLTGAWRTPELTFHELRSRRVILEARGRRLASAGLQAQPRSGGPAPREPRSRGPAPESGPSMLAVPAPPCTPASRSPRAARLPNASSFLPLPQRGLSGVRRCEGSGFPQRVRTFSKSAPRKASPVKTPCAPLAGPAAPREDRRSRGHGWRRGPLAPRLLTPPPVRRAPSSSL